MILAGDIGGTKTLIGLFNEDHPSKPVQQQRFASGDYTCLREILREFLQDSPAQPRVAAFAAAGHVSGGEAHITNLPWTINAQQIADEMELSHCWLINDVQAIATTVPQLNSADLVAIQQGQRSPNGAIAVVAPGTGLGEAFLCWTGTGYQAFPSEGGHASFAPNTREELNLLVYMSEKLGHVSFERVCSGKGIPHLLDFLREKGFYDQPDWLTEELAALEDRTPAIVSHALNKSAGICVAAMDMFVRILGSVIGNIILRVVATGGVYLAGGMPRRILPLLQGRSFQTAITNKGRFSNLCASVPIHVVTHPAAALTGAAIFAAKELSSLSE